MPKRCKPPPDWRELQDRIIGLGGDSIKKSHYPELRDRLRELERFRSLLNLSSDILLVIDIASARIVDWNVAARTALGYASPPTLTEIEATAIAILLQEETANPTEHPRRTTPSATFRRADGSRFPAEIAISIEAGNGNRQAIAIGRDITERIATERRLRRAATVFDNSLDGIMVLSTDGAIAAVNPAFTRITGHAANDIVGQPVTALRTDHQSEEFTRAMWATVQQKGYWRGEVWSTKKTGKPLPLRLAVSTVRNETGEAMQYVCVFSDISRVKESESRLAHLTHHDPLTQLPNRLMLASVLDSALVRARRSGKLLGLLFIDIDRFKTINDTLGHQSGDRLLQAVAARVASSVHANDMVAHISGDEFAVLLEDLATTEDASKVARKILLSFSYPFDLDGFDAFVSLSIGISLFPAHGQGAGALLRNCDTAVHQAKEDGGGRFRIYTHNLTKTVFKNLQIETSLRRSIEESGLELYYQPQFRLSDDGLCGGEALVRWHHPKRGLIPPDVFISRAEETGLIVPLGARLLLDACHRVKSWLDQGLAVVPVAVNVSGVQINSNPIVKTVTEALNLSGLPPPVETGNHRKLRHARHPGIHGPPACLAHPGSGTGDRRLRHRLCLAVVFAGTADQHSENRPRVCAQRPRPLRRLRDHRGNRRDGPRPWPAGGRRGRRNRRPEGLPETGRTRRHVGLSGGGGRPRRGISKRSACAPSIPTGSRGDRNPALEHSTGLFGGFVGGNLLNIRPVVFVVGLLLIVLALAMALPIGVSLMSGGSDWVVFAAAAAITLFIGLAMLLSCGGPKRRMTLRHAFLLTVAAWVILPLFAALPFSFSSAELSYTDGVFEAMSGLTTTGSTILAKIEDQTPSILIWRSTLQWLGGIGIILMAVTLLPVLRVGGMQIFKTEAFDTPEKIFSRISPIALRLVIIYTGLTAIWTGLYWAVGMTPFDAVNHAMTTLSTGGGSTAQDSLSHWRSPAILLVATAGMIVAALPFALYLHAVRAVWAPLFKDGQVRTFLIVLTGATAIIAAWLIIDSNYDFGFALMGALFHTTSIITGTGYTATDIQLWGGLPVALLFILQYVGGCAGSTTCGFKIFRFQLLYAAARVHMARMLRPHLVIMPHYNGRPLLVSVTDAVMAFFFLYALSVAWLTVGLSFLGLDFTTAISGASTAISNVGPGFGDIIGPSGNFSTLPNAAKWMLSFGMLVGRLEILSILVLFQPSFWRK